VKLRRIDWGMTWEAILVVIVLSGLVACIAVLISLLTMLAIGIDPFD
jgi:ABC-type nickel/cobalt efflux system permease component RcnA